MKVSLKEIKEAGACERDIFVFQHLYGNECKEVTLEACRLAAQNGLDLDWLVRRLLPEQAREVYREKLLSVYEKYREERLAARGTAAYKEVKEKWKKELAWAKAEALYYTAKTMPE